MSGIACIFMPWWGTPPGWESEFLERAMQSRKLAVVLVGDAAGFAPQCSGPIRIPESISGFEARASRAAGVKIDKRPERYPKGQAICELRCMMADVYPDVTEPYSWWGYGDWDVVWGDWDSYLTDEILQRYDAISSNSRAVNACFQLFRNAPAERRLYAKRMDLITSPEAHFMDESGLEEICLDEAAAGRLRCLCAGLNGHDRHPVWNRCLAWHRKLYVMDASGTIGQEVMKFHFPRQKRWPVEYAVQDC